MSFDQEEKPLADAELEMVVQVIRRGLSQGNQIEVLEEKLGNAAAAIQECKRRLKALERIGQEICRNYERAIYPGRKQHLTDAEAAERLKWIQQKSQELKAQLQ